MVELSTAITIGIASPDEGLKFEIVQTLKRLGYRNIIQTNHAYEAYSLLHDKKVDFLCVDYQLDEKPLHSLYINLRCPFKSESLPILTMTGNYQILPEDIVFLKQLGITNILATPFTQKSLSTNIISTWNKFHNKKITGPLSKLVSAARVCAIQKDREKVLKYTEEIEKLNPEGVEHLEIRALFELASGNRQEALPMFKEAAGKLGDPYVNYRLGWMLFQGKEYTVALAILNDIKEESFNLEQISELKGLCHFYLEKKEEALTFFAEHLKHRPKNGNVMNHMAICYKEMKKFDLAIRIYDTLLAISPSPEKILFNIALLYIQQNNQDQAIKTLKEITQKYPKYEKAKIKLAALLK